MSCSQSKLDAFRGPGASTLTGGPGLRFWFAMFLGFVAQRCS